MICKYFNIFSTGNIFQKSTVDFLSLHIFSSLERIHFNYESKLFEKCYLVISEGMKFFSKFFEIFFRDFLNFFWNFFEIFLKFLFDYFIAALPPGEETGGLDQAGQPFWDYEHCGAGLGVLSPARTFLAWVLPSFFIPQKNGRRTWLILCFVVFFSVRETTRWMRNSSPPSTPAGNCIWSRRPWTSATSFAFVSAPRPPRTTTLSTLGTWLRKWPPTFCRSWPRSTPRPPATPNRTRLSGKRRSR